MSHTLRCLSKKFCLWNSTLLDYTVQSLHMICEDVETERLKSILFNYASPSYFLSSFISFILFFVSPWSLNLMSFFFLLFSIYSIFLLFFVSYFSFLFYLDAFLLFTFLNSFHFSLFFVLFLLSLLPWYLYSFSFLSLFYFFTLFCFLFLLSLLPWYPSPFYFSQFISFFTLFCFLFLFSLLPWCLSSFFLIYYIFLLFFLADILSLFPALVFQLKKAWWLLRYEFGIQIYFKNEPQSCEQIRKYTKKTET